MNKKLVLFDIDGTLIRHVGSGIANWINRLRTAAKEVFHVDMEEFSVTGVHGKVDRQYAWMLLEPLGVSRELFVQKFPAFSDRVFDQLLADPTDQSLYHQIPEALNLVRVLQKKKNICLGVLTGNVKRVGDWKLTHAGYDNLFQFGVYGDQADDRLQLVRTVYEEANAFFGASFGPDNTVVIGDTSRDIECARHIGARVIAVTTGGHDRKTLEDAKPDLLVDSLMDSKVLAFIN